jgi:hypothetical protein
MKKYLFILILFPVIAQAQIITGSGKYVIIPKVGDSIATPEILPVGSTIIGNHNAVLGIPIQEAENDGDMLAKINGKKLPFPTLPAIGQQVIKDVIYQYEGKAVICRQTHVRQNYTPYETPALFSFYRAETVNMLWIPNEQVNLNAERTYNTVKYKCLQAHMTIETWRPDLTVGVLWSVINTTQAWAIGVAYKVGNIVTYEGSSYKCLQAHTSISTWYPSVVPSLWSKQ